MRIVMMGTGPFAEPVFRALLGGPHPVVGLATQPDRSTGHERGSTRHSGEGTLGIARAAGIPVIQPESINSPLGVAALRELAPELLVVASYGQILSRDVLSLAEHGGINVHASILPKYRGAAPIAWAIYLGETRTGVSIIRMSVHLDAGDILAVEALDIDPHETAGELESRLAPVGARLAMQMVDQVAAGTARGTPQDKSQATKAPKLTKEHGLIDWSRTALQVCNQVRAMQPWPTAYTFCHRPDQTPQRVIVSRAAVAPEGGEAHHIAGEILSHSSTVKLLVATGGGTQVEIIELQPAGKRKMLAADFLRGHPMPAGSRFGPEAAT